MTARELAGVNGWLAIRLKEARAAGAVGTDDEVTNAILAKHGAGEIDLKALLTRLRRGTPRRERCEKVRQGST